MDLNSNKTLPRVRKRRRVNSRLNDDSKEILIKAKTADIFPKLQSLSSAHLSTENHFQPPISSKKCKTNVSLENGSTDNHLLEFMAEILELNSLFSKTQFTYLNANSLLSHILVEKPKNSVLAVYS